MNKLLVILFAVALCALPSLAALDTYDSVTVKNISTTKTATGIETNAAVDVANAKGICNMLISIGPGYTNAADFGAVATLRHSTASAGTYYPVTNAAGSVVSASAVGITSVKVEADRLKRYVKLYTAVTNDACAIGGALLYSK
jgi:hypothetical protein